LKPTAPSTPPTPAGTPAGAPNAATPPQTATGAPGSSSGFSGAQQRRFDKLPPRPTLHPRRVTGGIRLASRPPAVTAGQSPAEITADTATATGWTWACARWMRPIEQRAPGEQLAEGLEYARAGQTRQLEIKPGMITAKVQGRMPQAYKVAIRLPTFTPEQWEKVSSAMASQAKYAASVLSGELPSNIEDLFAPAGLNLFPTDASDLSVSCECSVFTGKQPELAGISGAPAPAPVPTPKKSGAPVGIPWCKHVCCLMYLIADKFSTSPLSIFSIRGLAEQDLLERLRQARALQGIQRTGAGATPVYSPHVPGTGTQAPTLEESMHAFFTAPDPDALKALDMPISTPDVSHPLLRRMGASPFQGTKFPMVGLLATCYDVISQEMVRESSDDAQQPPNQAPDA
jgi:uncharacterized Zn finger protein